MEQIMSTTLTPSTPHSQAPARRRWPRFAAAGGATAAIAAGVAFAIGSSGGGGAASSVTYSLAGDVTMGMCLPVTDYVPAPGLVGLAGTVTSVGEDSVTINVSKWYAGGDADEVVLDTADTGMVALDGVEFVEGGKYLVAVLDGQVLTCGLSAPVDPALEALYDGWFGG
jgi:hypothetical protein